MRKRTRTFLAVIGTLITLVIAARESGGVTDSLTVGATAASQRLVWAFEYTLPTMAGDIRRVRTALSGSDQRRCGHMDTIFFEPDVRPGGCSLHQKRS